MMMMMRLLWALAIVSAVLPAGGAAQEVERIVPGRWRGTYDNFHYAPAVRVGNMLYLSGLVGTSRNGPNDIQAQSRRIFEAMEQVLAEAGANLSDVVELTTYHVDMGETVGGFMEIKDEFILEPYPTWTAVGVERLFLESALVEVKVVAALP